MLSFAIRDTHSVDARSWPGLVLRIALGTLLVLACPCVSRADNTFVVNSTADDGSPGTLRWAINQANAAGSGVQSIQFNLSANSQITLGGPLPVLDNTQATSIHIDGSGASGLTISGNGSTRVFFVEAGTVSLSHMTIAEGSAQGGNGGNSGPTSGGGGGGLGAGGGLFVNTGANVTLQSVAFTQNAASGGNGGQINQIPAPGGGGGGGLGGAGGQSGKGGGGGGGIYGAGGNGSNTGSAGAGGGGGGLTSGSNASGTTGGNGSAGAAGGGPSQAGQPGQAGGGGGGGGSAGSGGAGGTLGGGGGGGYNNSGASGGDFGGGGGAGESRTLHTVAGNGGFGGGGGGAATQFADGSSPGTGGFGAGNGGASATAGGGGNGYGGAVFVRDGGALTVIDSTFTNGTVAGGTGATNGTAAGTGLFLHGGTQLGVAADNNTTIADTIAGTGGLVKSGAASLTLSGANSYTGLTEIQAGRLAVNGSITSDTIVNAGATLGGTGTIHGAVTNNGNVAPGNSIGTLVIDGEYTQEAGTTLTIEINAAGTNPGVNNDLLLVDSATLNGGTVSVEAAAGTYSAGTVYHFLESNTPINGAFDGITGHVGGFGLELGYDFDGFFYWSYFRLIESSPEYWQYAATGNELAVANYLDSISDDPNSELQDMFDELNTLSGDEEAMQAAFNSLSDQVSPTTAQIGLQNTTLVLQQLAGQLRSGSFLTEPAYAKAGAAPVAQAKSPIMLVSYDKRSATPVVTFVEQADCDCWQGWSFGYGLGGNAQSDGNAAGLTYGMGGMLLGAERYFDRAGRVGFFGGYQGTNLQLDGLAQSGRINGGMFGGYLYNDDGFNYYTAITGLQFNGYDTMRNIQFAGIHETASGNFSGWQGYGYLERGVSFRRASTTLQPYAALQYIYLRQNNYTETGAGVLNLDVAGIDANSLRSLVGARLQYDRGWSGGRLLPELRALWLHEFLNTDSVVNSFFAPIGGGSFAIQGLNLGRDWAVVGGGLRYELASGWQLYGNYDAQVNTQQVFHVGSGGLAYAW